MARATEAVTADDVSNVARKYLIDKNSVTGYLLPAPEYTGSIGEQPANAPVRRQIVIAPGAWLPTATTRLAAASLLTSPRPRLRLAT